MDIIKGWVDLLLFLFVSPTHVGSGLGWAGDDVEAGCHDLMTIQLKKRSITPIPFVICLIEDVL
jgi:hypothetical protein